MVEEAPKCQRASVCIDISCYRACACDCLHPRAFGPGIDHPPPSSAEVKERVELYLYSTSGLSWPVIGWTLPLPYHELCLDMVTDWAVRSYVRRFVYIAFPDDDVCRSAVSSVCVTATFLITEPFGVWKLATEPENKLNKLKNKNNSWHLMCVKLFDLCD